MEKIIFYGDNKTRSAIVFGLVRVTQDRGLSPQIKTCFDPLSMYIVEAEELYDALRDALLIARRWHEQGTGWKE